MCTYYFRVRARNSFGFRHAFRPPSAALSAGDDEPHRGFRGTSKKYTEL